MQFFTAIGFAIYHFAVVVAWSEEWQGLVVAPENRCSEYDRDDYRYPQSVEVDIIARDGLVSPYTGETFSDRSESDIEHLVAISEAHDSGMCARSVEDRRLFARDLDNLVLASPQLNRWEKSDKDAADWLPPQNVCWFVRQVVAVKAEWDLTIDERERAALTAALEECSPTAAPSVSWGLVKRKRQVAEGGGEKPHQVLKGRFSGLPLGSPEWWAHIGRKHRQLYGQTNYQGAEVQHSASVPPGREKAKTEPSPVADVQRRSSTSEGSGGLAAPIQGPSARAKMDTYACRDRAFMESIEDAARAKDYQALAKANLAMAIASDCFKISKGTEVPRVDAPWHGGGILVTRRTGFLGEWYALNGLFDH